MFEFLFKYPAALYREGVVELSLSWDWVFVIAAAVVLATWLFLAPRPPDGEAGAPPGRAPLVVLRSALLVVIVLCLLSPRLVVEAPRAGAGRVAVLIDDSLSMRTPNRDGTTRAQGALAQFAPGSGTISNALVERFDVTYFRFGESTSPLATGDTLHFSAPGTNLAGAIGSVLDSTSQGEAPAILLVSDGGDDRVASLEDAIARLRLAGAPVYAVDMGAAPRSPDIAVAGVRAPARIRLGEIFEATVTLRHTGFDTRPVRVLLEEGGLVVAERRVTLPEGGRDARVDIAHRFDVAGPQALTVRVPVEAGESLVENNEMAVALQIADDVIDVLHLEGEPRFEVKFVRRALEGEPGIRIVSLVHTSDSKLFRVGVEDSGELAEGFPRSAEALFRYEVVILGSVPATRLDAAQQRLLAEFVGHRGGGLLVLGGRHAFAEGGYARTPLAGVMPVVLDAASAQRFDIRPVPGRFSNRHPILEGFEAGAWASLPPLAVVNPIRRIKPGAQVLLDGARDGGDALVMLAVQQYGRGRVAAFPVRNSWRWQMHGDVTARDTVHELFWRRLVRWLGQAAGGTLQVEAPSFGVPGRALDIAARVVDEAYRPVSGATLEVAIDTPDGARTTRPLSWRGDGQYGTRFTPTVAGRHDLRVTLAGGESAPVSISRAVTVSATGTELSDAGGSALMRRLAEATGGAYHGADEAGRLLADLAPPTSAIKELKRLPLWDMPFLYLLMLAFALAEWWLRRRRGLR